MCELLQGSVWYVNCSEGLYTFARVETPMMVGLHV